MVFPLYTLKVFSLSPYQPHFWGKTRNKHLQHHTQSSYCWLARSEKAQSGFVPRITFLPSSCPSFSTVASVVPNRRPGRFKRIHAEANLPQHMELNSSNTEVSSRTNVPVFRIAWPLLLSVSLACFVFHRLAASATPQHQITTGQAAVAMVSQTPHPSTLLQHPGGMTGQPHAFASISAAGFARLLNGVKRAHIAQIVVYQAQRVSFLSAPAMNHPSGVLKSFSRARRSCGQAAEPPSCSIHDWSDSSIIARLGGFQNSHLRCNISASAFLC